MTYRAIALGASLLVHHVNDRARCVDVAPADQRATNAKYYGFPTTDELDDFERGGNHLVSPSNISDLMLSLFSEEGTEHRRALAAEIESASRVSGKQRQICEASMTPSLPR